MNGVVGGSIASDFFIARDPNAQFHQANVALLRVNHVNIAIHEVTPMMAMEVIKASRTEKFVNMAKEAGAEKCPVYGICCSGLSSMYRLGELSRWPMRMESELVVATWRLGRTSGL